MNKFHCSELARHVHDATNAFVEATAGMMFLIKPSVRKYVTPSIPNSSARAVARCRRAATRAQRARLNARFCASARGVDR